LFVILFLIFRVYCTSKNFDSVANQTEQWYGAKYIIEDISKDDIKRWTKATPNPVFSFPPQNEFIPTDFSIVPLAENHSTVPILIKVRFYRLTV